MSETEGTQWRPVVGRRSSGEIVDQVMDRFFEMSPGEWLGTEGRLALDFGVSRVTIRDAVRELEARGMVEVRVGAGGGIRVAAHAPQRLEDALAVQVHLMDVSFDEMLEAQQALEPTAAGLAAERATPEEVAELRALLDLAGAAVDDPQRFSELSVRFHVDLAAAAHSRVLYVSLASLRHAMARRHGAMTTGARARRTVGAHEAIWQAVAAGDTERAAAEMAEHLGVVRRGGGAGGDAGCAVDVTRL